MIETGTIEDINPTPGTQWVEITKAAFDILVAADGLTPGTFYVISFIASSDFENTIGIFQADTTNTISNSGVGLFLNADYNSVGTYPPGLTWAGQWTAAGVFAVGDVVAYNNLHWENTTGVNGGNPPATPADWTQLAVEVGNGYILEADFIIYDYAFDAIVYRYDKRGNTVGNTTGHDIRTFQWGNSNVKNNSIQSGCAFECANILFVECIGNTFINSAQVAHIEAPAAFEFDNNFFDEGIFTSVTLAAGNFSRNKLSHYNLDTVTFTTAVDDVADNHLDNISIDTCTFTDFYGNGCKGLTLTACTNVYFFRNQVNESQITNATDCGWEYCTLNNLLCDAIVGGTTPEDSCFSVCIFNTLSFSLDGINLNGKIINASYSSGEIQYRFATPNFNGGAGAGAIGAVTITPNMPVPTDYFCYQTIYDREAALVGVGAALSLGFSNEAPTGLVSAAVGTVAAYNATPSGFINANNTTKSAAQTRAIVAAVSVAPITAGRLVFTAIFKHANKEY